MAYIPKSAEWFIAELINEITVEGEIANVVHRNFVLVSAQSPEDAYAKALEIGAASGASYDNPDGKQVEITFRGLADLNVIHDRLEHGAELMYEEETNISGEQICSMVRPKSELAIFREDMPAFSPKSPDYSSGEIVRQVNEIINETK